ncbi:MAG: tellurite methyltransferase [Microbacteriaceae bacterium]|nr:tellurite methyltransferase [Microbacteriaceae bacterium]
MHEHIAAGVCCVTMDWTRFYEWQTGRELRATFLAGLASLGERQPGFAIDLGCGDGLETKELISRGWRVLAIDSAPGVTERVRAVVGARGTPAVEVWQRDFADIHELPEADFVHAGFSLPFCDASHFPYLWADIRQSLRPGAVFAGELFGPDDAWFGRPGMNFHSRSGVEAMLDGLEVVHLIEDNQPGRSFEGPKHWHVFHIVARAPAADGPTAA